MADLLERVLLPVAHEEDAVATARALKRVEQQIGSLQAVHVIEKAGGGIDKAGVEQREEEAEEAFDALRSALSHPVETRITYGTDVAEAIFDAANDVDATSIVITPRGGSRWIRLLTGDVALSLITESDRPVLVLPDEADEDPETADPSEADEEEPTDEGGDRA